MQVWLALRDHWPVDDPRRIDARYGVDPDFADYVHATIADLAPEVD